MICNCCGKEKPEDEFYKAWQRQCRRQPCKRCYSLRIVANRGKREALSASLSFTIRRMGEAIIEASERLKSL